MVFGITGFVTVDHWWRQGRPLPRPIINQPLGLSREALVATALGLVAAIPAVVAYNHFVNKVNVLTGEMDNFCQEFLNIVERMGRRG